MPPDPIDPASERPLPAVDVGAWLTTTIDALEGRAEADVPCGTCVACCSSRQFVHVEPDEVDTLAHIPAELRFPAPGLPPGYVVLPYDTSGRCPMLTDAGCSIYEHRPRTCRIYDCRVFVAAGVEPDDDQPLIAAEVHRWRFDVADDDRVRADAVRAMARVLGRAEAHPDGRVPPRAGHVAAMAVGLHLLAIRGDRVIEPTAEAVRVAIGRRRSR